MEPVRYGIVGFGGIAQNRIAPEGFGVSQMGGPSAESGFRLVGATDANATRETAVCELGLEWFGSISEMLASPSIDAVVITTNNKTHYAIADEALRTGKHCIVEKPIATDVQRAVDLSALAVERRLSLCMNRMMQHNAYNILARETVFSGRLGEVNDIVLHMEFAYGHTSEEAGSWRCADPAEIGGPIGDVGSHCLYMAEYLLGSQIRELSCAYLPGSLSIAVEAGAYVAFRTEDGTRGSIRVSFDAPRGGLLGTLSNLGFEIYGSAGVLRSFGTLFQLSGHSDEPYHQSLQLESEEGVTELEPRGIRNIYRAMIEEHARSIQQGTPMNGAGGLHNLRLVVACHESARSDARFETITG